MVQDKTPKGKPVSERERFLISSGKIQKIKQQYLSISFSKSEPFIVVFLLDFCANFTSKIMPWFFLYWQNQNSVNYLKIRAQSVLYGFSSIYVQSILLYRFCTPRFLCRPYYCMDFDFCAVVLLYEISWFLCSRTL